MSTTFLLTRRLPLAVVAGALLALAAAEVVAQDCVRRVCRRGETLEPYMGRLVCVTGNVVRRDPPSPLCPPTATRVGQNCVDRCCKSACDPGHRYEGGRCQRGETPGGVAFDWPKCDPGWELYLESGWCARRDCPRNRPVPPAGGVALPDLAIESFSVRSTGPCRPGRAVVTFDVVVVNRGTGPFTGTRGADIVHIVDRDRGWGATDVPLAAIPAGGRRTATVPFYYAVSNPRHMTAAASHPFRATLDPWRYVIESNEGNNQSRTLSVAAPSGCP